jgi:hypothetical protein
MLHAELTHCIENPIDLDRGAARRAANRVENRRELLSLPQHHAGGHDDFGVAHVLLFQPFQQAPRDERIVFGRAQPFANGAESLQEGVEIGIAIERAKFLDAGVPVELVQSFGFDRTFQVQM